MSIQSNETRIAVLEKITENHDKRISDMEDFHRDVVDRFDQKIIQDAANQVQLERTLAKAVSALDIMTSSIRDIGATASEAAKISNRHEVIALTIMKAASVLVIIGSAAWAVFTYFSG